MPTFPTQWPPLPPAATLASELRAEILKEISQTLEKMLTTDQQPPIPLPTRRQLFFLALRCQELSRLG